MHLLSLRGESNWLPLHLNQRQRSSHRYFLPRLAWDAQDLSYHHMKVDRHSFLHSPPSRLCHHLQSVRKLAAQVRRTGSRPLDRPRKYPRSLPRRHSHDLSLEGLHQSGPRRWISKKCSICLRMRKSLSRQKDKLQRQRKLAKKMQRGRIQAEIIDKVPVKERQPTKQVSKPAKPTQTSEPNMETRNDSTSFETVQKRTEVRDADVERPSSRTQPASSRSAISQTGTSSKPGTTQLRFRNQKPKRKLMYRALLPSSRHTQTPSGDSSSRASVERASAVFYDIDPQLSLIPDAPDQRLPVITPSSRRGSVDEPVEVPSSPLVVPQDGHVESPVRSPRSSQDGLEARMIGSPGHTRNH